MGFMGLGFRFRMRGVLAMTNPFLGFLCFVYGLSLNLICSRASREQGKFGGNR